MQQPVCKPQSGELRGYKRRATHTSHLSEPFHRSSLEALQDAHHEFLLSAPRGLRASENQLNLVPETPEISEAGRGPFRLFPFLHIRARPSNLFLLFA